MDGSTNKALKRESAFQGNLTNLYDLQPKLNDLVHWHDRKQPHSTLGYMSPMEFKEAGLSI